MSFGPYYSGSNFVSPGKPTAFDDYIEQNTNGFVLDPKSGNALTKISVWSILKPNESVYGVVGIQCTWNGTVTGQLHGASGEEYLESQITTDSNTGLQISQVSGSIVRLGGALPEFSEYPVLTGIEIVGTSTLGAGSSGNQTSLTTFRFDQVQGSQIVGFFGTYWSGNLCTIGVIAMPSFY
jgi:hypothetical protein